MDINFNSPPPNGSANQITWLVQAVQLLSRRINALASSGGGPTPTTPSWQETLDIDPIVTTSPTLDDCNLQFLKGGNPSGSITNSGDGTPTTLAIGKIDGVIAVVELFAPVAFDGVYDSLIGIPAFANVAFSGSYNDLLDLPPLAPVATSGSYADLLNVPISASPISEAFFTTQSTGITVLSAFPSSSLATYRLDWAMNVRTATVSTVTVSFMGEDDVPQSVGLSRFRTTNGTLSYGTGYGQGVPFTFRAKAGTPIVMATTVSGTPDYDICVVLTQLTLT